MSLDYRGLRSRYRTLTAPLRGLPSGLIIGAQKGGTSSLFHYLVQHPEVVPPANKEIHYFDTYYDRGDRWYRGRFPFQYQLRGGACTLEATPYYLPHPLAPARAFQLLPHAKLIALLRNPVDRAFSHYQHVVRAGGETLSFPEAVEQEPVRLAGEENRLRTEPGYHSIAYLKHSYLRRGHYVEDLRRWAEHYPRSQLLVLQSEWFFRDPAGATSAVQQFLGLRPYGAVTYRPVLQGSYDREMPPALRRRLVAYFEPYNRALYQWLGREFDWDA
jgi:hypothetical protein